MIEVNDLWFEYKKNQPVLKNISLSIKKGEMVTIIGQNGSGKTSLVKHFNGLLKPTSGTVKIGGTDTKNTTIATLSKDVAYVFQNPNHQVFSSTVYDEIAFALKRAGEDEETIQSKVYPIAKDLGLTKFLNTHPMFINHAEKQMVAVASYLVSDPEIFIFDEPTSALDAFDSVTMNRVFKKLIERNKTVIVISHDMNFVVEYSKRVIVMDKAEILFDGEAKELFTKDNIFNTTSLELPQIKRLTNMLGKDIPKSIYTPEDLYEYLIERGLSKK